ncbi:hypothetical protein BOTBODRAFT_426567 [Botryobasidium botryosum FD-172 SS1]|uniref:Uncharacterized protein n=1 Tax=Botryobasidium botryosum (strain FD-172 SS1) TaxID=930990 RepID=A0A067MKV2_BOTB1|nr:hypothetical protein BOTBODRAFT_426567 [Botryobasidium botryosum FD-172 SS1]
MAWWKSDVFNAILRLGSTLHVMENENLLTASASDAPNTVNLVSHGPEFAQSQFLYIDSYDCSKFKITVPLSSTSRATTVVEIHSDFEYSYPRYIVYRTSLPTLAPSGGPSSPHRVEHTTSHSPCSLRKGGHPKMVTSSGISLSPSSTVNLERFSKARAFNIRIGLICSPALSDPCQAAILLL